MTGLWCRVARWWSGSHAEPLVLLTAAQRVLAAIHNLQAGRASPGAVAAVVAASGERLTLPTIYLALDQIEATRLVIVWAVAATPKCSGRDRLRYCLTVDGMNVLAAVNAVNDRMAP